MLSLMAFVDQWRAIRARLPEGWSEVRLRVTVHDAQQVDRAAALLAPANAGRHGNVITFSAGRGGNGPSVDLVTRLLARLDAARIKSTLGVVRVSEAAAPAGDSRRSALADQWARLLAALPEDWSDLYGEIELRSSDYLERGALLLAPVNPARAGSGATFRFRVARRFGYGAAPEMARRCFERLDEANIRGELRILRALSDTRPVYTQGPVWYVGGRAV